jgi:hypothetical protein
MFSFDVLATENLQKTTGGPPETILASNNRSMFFFEFGKKGVELERDLNS